MEAEKRLLGRSANVIGNSLPRSHKHRGRSIAGKGVPDSEQGRVVPLTFGSVAVFDPASRGIKFAGRHIDPRGVERFVICQVSGEALRTRFHLEDPSPEQLLAAYRQIQDHVHRAAAKRFAAGEKRPAISDQDLP